MPKNVEILNILEIIYWCNYFKDRITFIQILNIPLFI